MASAADSRADGHDGDRVPPFLRREARPILVLTGLSALAIAQPLFSLLALDATIFQARASNRWVLVLFSLSVVVVPPLALWAVEVLAGAVRATVRPIVHGTSIAFLGTILMLQALKSTGLGEVGLVAVSLLVGIGLAYVEQHYDAIRRWLAYLAGAAPILLLLFLFFSPVRGFLTASTHDATPVADLGADDGLDPVVMIVLDELGTSALLDGQGAIDTELFPNLAALSEDSTWYRNHTTVGPHTPLALSAILTGQTPSPELAESVVASNFDGSLLSLLGASHELNVYEPITRFCMPEAGCRPHPDPSAFEQWNYLTDYAASLFRQNVDPRLEAVSVAINEASRDEGEPADYFDAFLEDVGEPAGDRPPLDLVHLTLPHSPYRYLQDGSQYDGPAQPDGATSWQGPWVDDESAWTTRQRHLLQAQYTDTLVGEVVERLRDLDRYDESLIVVTADHGSAFRADSVSRGVSQENIVDVAWTPLIVKLPGQDEGVVDDTPVTNLDILPLIAAGLGIEIPWEVDGLPVGDRPDDEPVQILDWAVNEAEADEDGFVETSRIAGFEELLASDAFGQPGADAQWRPYQRGPYASLVGRPIDDLDLSDQSATVAVQGIGDEIAVPPDAEVLPLYLRGTADAEGAIEIAVVVDGVVVTVLVTHPDLDGRFFGVVPSHALHEGTNDLHLYVIEGDPDQPVLHPLSRD